MRGLHLLLLALLIAPLLANGESTPALGADQLVAQGLAAEARMDPRQALAYFQQADRLRPNDAFILQKISRQYSDSTILVATTAEKRALAEEALAYSKRAYALAPGDAVVALSLAICYGKLGLYSSVESRIQNARLIQQYAEEAVRLNPNYDWAHHVLGRWHYEVAGLSGTKRFFAKVLYGGLPRGSVATAIEHLERAVALAPETTAHHIELGFAYLAAGRNAEAEKSFQAGLALPVREIHDGPTQERAREALRKLSPGR